MLDLPHTFTFEGNAVRWGKMGRGSPLVAIHGTPFSSQVWRRIVPHLAPRHTVYFFDLPGYGQSEQREGQDVSLGIQNRLLSALVREWGVEQPHILAHDFGAATALRAHVIDGLRYASLTVFDAVALSPWGTPLVQHVRQHQAAFAGMPAYMHAAILRAYLQTAAYEDLSKEALQIYAGPWTGPIGQAAFYRQISQMDERYTAEIVPRLQSLDCPTRVLWGEEDTWLPPEQGDKLAALISDRPCIRIPGAGHLVQEDRPEAIVAAMLDAPSPPA